MSFRRMAGPLCAGLIVGLVGSAGAVASSHREAPGTAAMPTIDATDFYMFRSYEKGREGFVTLIANYIPLQDPYGGPNYFKLNSEAVYAINIDNNGDGVEDVVFEFRFTNTTRGLPLNIGGVSVPVALNDIGQIGPGRGDTANLNVLESYGIKVVRPGRSTSSISALGNAMQRSFQKPADNIGNKTIPAYEPYAADHIYSIFLAQGQTGRVFVGQRKDPFAVNLGEIFDLVNLNPLGSESGEPDDLADKNVTSIVLEVPIAFLTQGSEPVIGGWTTASMPRERVPASCQFAYPFGGGLGSTAQVSRLGMPLINELVIGLPDKDRFNSSRPRDDAQFLRYVTNPTLPAILQLLFPAVTAPCLPRNDLVAIALTGIAGLNKPANARPSEMLRLNTSIAARAAASQNRLGVLGLDLAGFPNGRRPGDDVVDISLRAVMGAVIPNAGMPGSCAPSGNLPFTDGTFIDATRFGSAFPYLVSPLPGSPN